MKTITLKIAAFALIALSIVGTGCRSKKIVDKGKLPDGEVLIQQYCSGSEFFSDKKFFRSNSVGESMDQATSKKKAMINAKGDLASFINTTIKSTIDNYVNSRETNNREDLQKRLEGLTREVVDQEMAGIKVICEKLTKTQNANYKTYLALELNGEDLVKAIQKRLSGDEKLRNDYDYEKFKATFDKEMEKLQNK